MFLGDDGRYYSSEAEWEYAYDEGCREELRALMAAEADCGDDEGYDDFIGPVQPRPIDDEIPF